MKNLTIPLAILVAGAFIGGAFLLRGDDDQSAAVGTAGTGASEATDLAFRDIDKDDHVLGNPDAQIFLIEYADTECQFCKSYHSTLQRIMEDYGKTGSVAWVYRHFPLAQVHSQAPKEAEATECAAELGGNDAFWRYLDRLFEITPSNNELDLALLPQIANFVGLPEEAFTRCLESGRHAAAVQQDFDDARRAGANGTPFLIISNGKSAVPLSGMQPYEALRLAIEQIIQYESQRTGTPLE